MLAPAMDSEAKVNVAVAHNSESIPPATERAVAEEPAGAGGSNADMVEAAVFDVGAIPPTTNAEMNAAMDSADPAQDGKPNLPPRVRAHMEAVKAPRLLDGTFSKLEGGEEEADRAKADENPVGWASDRRGQDSVDTFSDRRGRDSVDRFSHQDSHSTSGPRLFDKSQCHRSQSSRIRLEQAQEEGRSSCCCFGMTRARFAECYSVPVDPEVEEAAMGWNVQPQVNGPPAGSDKSFKSMARRYLTHILCEVKFYSFAIASTVLPVLAVSFVASPHTAIGGVVDSRICGSPVVVMIGYIEFHMRTPVLDELFSPLPSVIYILSLAGTLISLCGSWSWELTGRICRWGIILPTIFLGSLRVITIAMKSAIGCELLVFIRFFSDWIETIVVVMIVPVCSWVLRRVTGNLSFDMFIGSFFMGTAIQVVLDHTSIKYYMPCASDLTKVGMVIALSLVFEVFCLTWARMAARALRGNHWSTACLIPAFFGAWKSRHVRAIVAEIQSPWYTVLSVTVSGIGEYLLRVSMKMRDEAVYRRVSRSWTENPLAQLANDRSKNIRSHTFVYESMCSVAFVVSSCLWNVLMDISPDGVRGPSAKDMLTSVLIQVFAEVVADFAALLTLKKVYGYDIMAKASGRSWKWALMVSPLMMFWSAADVLAKATVLCRTPSGHPAEWYFCSVPTGQCQ